MAIYAGKMVKRGHVARTNRYIVGIRFDHEVDAIADLLLAVAIY